MVARPVITAEGDATEYELQRPFDKMTFVIATGKLAQPPHWMKVSADLVNLYSKGGPIRDFRCAEAT